MIPELFANGLATLFHGAVVSLGLTVLWYARKLHKYQLRTLEMEREDRHDPVFRRVIQAAKDWYDDKPDSKRLLREAVGALKEDPHHPRLPPQVEERFIWYDGPYGKEEMKVEAHPLVWAELDDLRKDRACTCQVCKAPPGAKCDAGLHS